jgi:dTDP-glucose 4,6-dehydratase
MSLQSFNFIQEDLKDLFSKVKPDELSALKNEHVCITGGAGFVGSWLSEVIHYLNENYKFNTSVLIIDRNLDNVKKLAPHLLNSKMFNFKKADIRYLVDLPKEVSYVIHAAAFPDSRDHVTTPVEVMSTIALGTEATLRAAERLSNLRMFLNLSSSLVYGSSNNRSANITENDFALMDEQSSSAIYAQAKKYSELMCNSFRQQYRMPIINVRPFTLAGPYQSLTGPWALNNFISDAIKGNSIKVLGDGETQRSFLYASDMAFWILKILLHGESGSKFNLGNSEVTSLKDLAFMVRDQFKIKTDVIFHSGSVVHSKKSRMIPDTTLTQKTFHLPITVPLKKAVERTIQWNMLAQK